MCQFFSGIAFRNGDIKFTEEDHHTTLIERLGLDDSKDLFTRGWVRFEVLPQGDGWAPVRVDETSFPGWWDDDRVAFEDRVLAVATRVRPAWAADAESARVRAAVWAANDRVTAAARAEYVRVGAAARAEYAATIRTIDGYVPAETGA